MFIKKLKKHKKDTTGVQVKGHVLIKDDQGNVLLDKDNAIHSRNMARILARGLANEPNSSIYRMAFGNGGTRVDAANEITYGFPNDGQAPNDLAGWASRLHKETYSEGVDETSVALNVGPGSDPSSTDDDNSVFSSDVEASPNYALVTVTAVLGMNEPRGQSVTDNLSPTEYTEEPFTFDEIGLYTEGLPNVATSGYHEIDVGGGAYATLDTDTGLAPATLYDFRIAVDTLDTLTPTFQVITVLTPAVGTGAGTPAAITYGDLITALTSAAGMSGVSVTFNDPGNNVNTFGYLKFTSKTYGSLSSIIIEDPGNVLDPYDNTFLFGALASNIQYRSFVVGNAAGVETNPSDPALERERLLTHIIFSPILKSANRSLIITYTLTIIVTPSS